METTTRNLKYHVMHNLLTLLHRLFLPAFHKTKTRFLVTSLLGLTLWSACALSNGAAEAAPPETAPPELKEMLRQIDAAANAQDIKVVMEFFSPNFSHSDGLNRETMEKALVELWKRYPKLNYRTELQSWQIDGRGIVAETVTYITGVEQLPDREMYLTATLRSRQRYENKKIVQQEILAERSQLTSGTNPPTLNVKLAERLPAGQEFTFDAIIREPLGKQLIMGAALEEIVNPENYFNATEVKLSPLSSGGLFKIGRAPTSPTSHWLSAIVVRHDGITAVTKRVQVSK